MNSKAIGYYLCFFASLFIAAYSFFFLTFNTLFQFVGSAGGFVSATAIFILFISNLPTFQKSISPILGAFKWLKRAEMASIAYNIQGTINQFRDTVNKETADLIPEAQVEWVTKTNRESFFDGYRGKVIIRMKPCKDNDVNLARAAFLQVSKGVIPESRLYVGTKLSLAIDLALVEKMLLNQGKKNAYRYFVNEMAVPELEDENILRFLKKIEVIDGQGFFTRLFLRELKELPVVSGLKFENLSEARNDVNHFFDYCEIVANRKEHELITLNYEGTHIRSAIIYVAIKARMAIEGAKPYVKRALRNKANKAEIIFFIAFSHAIEFSRMIIEILTKSYGMELISNSDKDYEVDGNKLMCATLLVNPNFVVSPQDDFLLHDILIEAIKSSVDDSGWADLRSVERSIKEKLPNFSVVEYGYHKLADLLLALGFLEVLTKDGSNEAKVRPKAKLVQT